MNVEPQWLQDLSNNFKKLHLNKLWHLLPSKVSPAISTHEQPEQNPTTKQPFQQAPQIEPTEPTQSLITTVNVSAPKNEPKTAEPSPNTNQYDANQQMNYDGHNQAQYAASADYSYSMNQQAQNNDLSYDINRLNLNSNEQSYQQYDQSQYQQQQYQNDMQSYQQASDSNLAPAHQQQEYNMNADYQNNQYYQPPDTQQHQTQPVVAQQAPYNPYASTQSRKSSTNSINHIPNESSSLGKSSYPSVSMQNIYNPGQRRPSNSSDAQAAQYTRSRNNSSSADNVFAPFNPYQPPSSSRQQQEIQQPGYFDPNASANLSKSQTFPSNKTNQIKEEEDSDDEDKKKPKKKQNYYDDEDEDDLKLANSKDGAQKDDAKNKNQPAGANKGWLTGIMSYIKPPNAPKKMVLPDDKKKTVLF